MPTFSKFDDDKLEKVFSCLDLQDWSAGETVFQKGEVCDSYKILMFL